MTTVTTSPKHAPMTAADVAILHLALNPITGPWSVLRELAAAQAASGAYAGVAIGVVADHRWPAPYRDQLANSGRIVLTHPTPALFGTAAFLWQALRPPPLAAWIETLRQRTGAQRVVVHIHNAWMSGVFLPLPGMDTGATVAVATFHGINARLEGQPLRRAAHQWMARRLGATPARLTSVDRSNLTVAERLFNLPPTRFSVIPNGVPPAPRPGAPYATAGGVFTVGHVGSLTARKGWQIAAEAVRRVAAAGDPVRLVIAGDGEDREAVQAFVRDHPTLAEYVGFLPDPRIDLMPRLDLLAVMSVMEGLPMNIVEAMSAGVPVAATRAGGIPEAVADQRTGALIERTPEALAAIIRALIADPARLARWSRAARERFASHFDISRIVAAYEHVYLE